SSTGNPDDWAANRLTTGVSTLARSTRPLSGGPRDKAHPKSFSTTTLSRCGRAFLVVGQELLQFFLQTADDRGRLLGAIGQNEPDIKEDGPAIPFVLGHAEVLGLVGPGAVRRPLLIQSTEPRDGFRQAPPPGEDFLRHVPFGLLAAMYRILDLIQLLLTPDFF